MNPFKKIRSWFYGTKPGLRVVIRKLSRDVRDLGKGLKSLEQDLWKERKFKEDYRDRLTRYYDECIILREKVKKYNKLLKKCKDFKGFFGKNCRKFTSDLVGREGTKKCDVSKRRG